MTVELDLEPMVNKRDWTFYRLAVESGISHAVMYKLRHGKMVSIRFDVLAALCAALECTPNDLLKLKPAGGKRGKK